MLFFGHIGITAGVVRMWDLTTSRIEARQKQRGLLSKETSSGHRFFLSAFRRKLGAIDYRLIVLGSLLPDIVDKPIWLFSSSNFQWSGRGYAHTSVFAFVLLLSGLVMTSRWGRSWLLSVAVGNFFHLLFDQMWRNQTVFWWPLFGTIERRPTTGWYSGLWEGLISNPYVYVSESLGFLIVLYVVSRVIAGKQVVHFLKTGDFSRRRLPIKNGSETVTPRMEQKPDK